MRRRAALAGPIAAAPMLLAACAGPGGPGGGGAPGAGASTAPPIAAPGELVGLSAAEVERRIGEPGFVRRDGSAQIWQYGGRDCLLDVFLYREAGATTVRYAELRRRGNRTVADRACLADALTERS